MKRKEGLSHSFVQYVFGECMASYHSEIRRLGLGNNEPIQYRTDSCQMGLKARIRTQALSSSIHWVLI